MFRQQQAESGASATGSGEGNPQDDGDQQQQQHLERTPLLGGDDVDDPLFLNENGSSSMLPILQLDPSSPTAAVAASESPAITQQLNLFRSRKSALSSSSNIRQKKRRTASGDASSKIPSAPSSANNMLPSTTFSTCMNLVAKMVLWLTVISLAAAAVWYSYELFNHGTDPHLIAWFSAGAFVLLGFPISMYGIVSHLANYNQPHVQAYVVRILWMVPLYSIESWLAMRFHKQAIYIETLRDLYESYVLYSFLQFLIQVLGGEEALILMLKDKSPTRGFHMWGLQWCVKPWLMGQPVRKISIYERKQMAQQQQQQHELPVDSLELEKLVAGDENDVGELQQTTQTGGPMLLSTPVSPSASSQHQVMPAITQTGRRAGKRVHWKSPFFIKCKFGVLQYVLLKFVTAIAVFILEMNGLYKEGNFTYKGGYLYICILTNLSQCWALYCLIIFYYATHTELAPIRPVGKFLSVKSLVFFTWWQSVAISILYQMDMIPHYKYEETNWTPEDVAKAIQDYLICIEMLLAAVVHTFVFPHTEYTPQAVQARTRALSHIENHPTRWHHKKKRLGRKYYNLWKDDGSKSSATREQMEMELATFDSSGHSNHTAEEIWSDLPLQQNVGSGTMAMAPDVLVPMQGRNPTNHSRTSSLDSNESPLHLAASWDLEDSIMRPPQPPVDAIEEGEDEDYSENNLRRASADGSGGNDDGSEYDSDVDDDDEDQEQGNANDCDDSDDAHTVTSKNPGFIGALLDSTIPKDLRDNAVGIVKGDYRIEKKTLLHHAATSDQYDIFSHRRRPFKRKPEAS